MNPLKSLKAVFTTFLISIAFVFTGNAVYGQFILSGVLTENTTLTSSNNPYVVIQDLVVPSGITLTIEPGTHIRFSADTRLVVRGSLVARGLPGDSIYFYHVSNPNPAIWKGIVFDSTTTVVDNAGNYVSGSVLSYASIYHSTYAITISGDSKVLVEHALIRNSDFGFYFNDSHDCIIRNCRISGTSLGVFFPSGYTAFRNQFSGNEIENNFLIGVVINNCNGTVRDNLFTSNRIKANYIGIYAGNEGSRDIGHNIFLENRIINNTFEGIRVYQDSTWLQGNFISGNKIGVNFRHCAGSTLKENYFSQNEQWGVLLSDSAMFNTLSGNTITSNGGGIHIMDGNEAGSTENSILHNTLYQNSGYSFLIETAPQAGIHFNNLVQNGDTNSFVNKTSHVIHAENNWWGTVRETCIDSIIFDLHDDVFKGEVIYKQVLSAQDTLSPILPPTNVVKKQAGQDVLVSWDTVSVADIGGYTIHFGNYDGYSFSTNIEAGIAGSYIIPNHSVFDSIAVSAHDLQSDGINDQAEGHRSSYVFALLSPYAGPDTVICVNSVLHLDKATAFNYEFIDWSTSGDGTFSGIHVLKTRYTPGPLDYQAGQTELTLNVRGAGFQISDQVLVRYGQPPFAFAGNDSTLFSDTLFYTTWAELSSDKGLLWESTGDGAFTDASELHTVYAPGQADIQSGRFTLILHALSYCGELMDSVDITLVKGSMLNGRVFAGTELAPGSGLDLYQWSGGEFNPAKNDFISNDGTFRVGKLFSGNYYLYAIPDPLLFPGYAPAYYPDKIHWKDAYLLPLEENTYDLDIRLVKFSAYLPQGTGVIGGNCVATGSISAECEGTTVLLYDKTATYLLGWTLVQPDGTYHFEGLPFGEYIVVGERAGFERAFSERISLDPGHPEVLNTELRIEPFKISVWVPEQANGSQARIRLFPQPSGNYVTITGLPFQGDYTVEIFTADGRSLIKTIGTVGAVPSRLDISFLSSGLYLLRIGKDQKTLSTLRLIKE